MVLEKLDNARKHYCGITTQLVYCAALRLTNVFPSTCMCLPIFLIFLLIHIATYVLYIRACKCMHASESYICM